MKYANKKYFSILVNILIVTLSGALMSSCKQQNNTGTQVFFNETGNDLSAQTTRMLVSKKYLRIDDGTSTNDFLLFDRKKRIIYSTNSMDQRILVIKPRPLDRKSPVKLENTVKKITTDAPPIEGKKVTHLALHTNKKICYDLFAVDGFLPDVTAALKEYRQALAGEQAIAIDTMPSEMLQACDLANNVFHASRHLEHGFPIRLKETNGKFRELVDYMKNFRIAPELFVLPEGYSEFTTEDIRNR
jgi:hypothetical protein